MRIAFLNCFSICMVFFLAACASLNTEMMIVYIDQNNNSYTITPKKIKYIAIKPNESSSGYYSGGFDKETKISLKDFKKLNTISDFLFQETAFHAQRREMMTSVIKRSSSSQSEQVILYASVNRNDFEMLLKSILE